MLKCIEYQKNVNRVLLIGFSLIIFIGFAPAFAIAPSWDFFPLTLNDGGVGFPPPVGIQVTDPAANLNAAAIDTISISITSTLDPDGVELTLVETGVNDGIFRNTNLIFMRDNYLISLNHVVTITVEDPTFASNGMLDTIDDVRVLSTSDALGFRPTLTETSPDSGIFKVSINFDSATNPNTNTLEVTPGDILTVRDLATSELANGLIVPNPDSSVGAIQAEIAVNSVTATYQEDSTSIEIVNSGNPGRGGGGLIPPSLVLDFLGGGSCRADCGPPTLGLTKYFTRIVDEGFSYNGNPVNVELFYTPYPLIKTEVGKENTLVLKIFDDQGPKNIAHVGLAFGLSEGQRFSESKASIFWDRKFNGTEIQSAFDPENALENVKIETSEGKCKEDSETVCLIMKIFHTFREPLEFNMVSTYVWDYRRNGWQNYYNHGVQIEGDSLNPPETTQIAVGNRYHRGLLSLTQIDKTSDTWVDEYGNYWQQKGKDNFIILTTPESKRSESVLSSHGYSRTDIEFNTYKKGQTLLAEEALNKNCPRCLEKNYDKLYNTFTHLYQDRIPKLEKPEVIEGMQQEEIRAIQKYKKIMESTDRIVE